MGEDMELKFNIKFKISQKVTFADLEAEQHEKNKNSNIVMPLNTEFDIPTAIETLWIG